jgi:bifunctional ADP-heptose synthase (sugar kinase/adenylyltransferase)
MAIGIICVVVMLPLAQFLRRRPHFDDTASPASRASGQKSGLLPKHPLLFPALVLAGLAHVDLVAPFDEDTPLELIKAARPDVLVKGADYTVEGVVGHELVQSWGGEVKLAPIVEGYSTSAAIARITEKA